MSKYEKIAERMRSDWDRRISHDYRFWMSDGYADDDTMWRTGERDFSILVRGIESTEEKSILEVGCGVGRLLRAAQKRFKDVIGLDVSSEALEKAKELLSDCPNVRLVHGSGYDLSEIETGSIDVVVSFAAITSIPTEVITNYLREIHRVLKPGGELRLQCYLGASQKVRRDDTLHLRCYCREDFEAALTASGFKLNTIDELVLPFQVSFKELGIEAVIVALNKEEREPAESEKVAELLLPGGEAQMSEREAGNDLEYWMTVNYAKELAEQGDLEHARETLEFAVNYNKNASIDVRDLLDRIVAEIDRKEVLKSEQGVVNAVKQQSSAPVNSTPCIDSDALERNLRVIADHWPDLHVQIKEFIASGQVDAEVSVEQTSDGAVVFLRGQCLDHPTKPVFAAEKWAIKVNKEVLVAAEAGAKVSSVAVFGMGCGYHLEQLIKLTGTPVSVIEPKLSIFVKAIETRDLTAVLTRIDHLAVGNTKAPEFFDDGTHLVVRPQSQVTDAEFCNLVRATFYGERGLRTLHPRIGVLGPMMGGTLPIMDYTSRSLEGLSQRTVQYDVSGFAGGFNTLDDLVRDDMRKAISRGRYSEMISSVILDSVDEKPIDILICMAQAPITGAVLNELRRRGVITVLWFVEDYLRFQYWQASAQFYDFVFTIQRGQCLDLIKQAGAGHVHYLPTACDPVIHAPVEVPEDERDRWGSPVSFVGAGYHNRQQMFASLVDFPFKVWGTEWPECFPFSKLVQEGGRRLKPEEYVKIFNCTDVNINLHSSTERDGVDPYGDFINPRTFELASAGAFQLVDTREYLAEVFEPGKEVATFESLSELKEKIRYYTEHREERLEMAAAARRRVLAEHTYMHRLREMLSVIYSQKYEQLKRREDASPWNRLLQRAKKHDEFYRRCDLAYKRGEDPRLDGLVADIVTGQGDLTETEQKLLFLFHVQKQIKRMRAEESGGKK